MRNPDKISKTILMTRALSNKDEKKKKITLRVKVTLWTSNAQNWELDKLLLF